MCVLELFLQWVNSSFPKMKHSVTHQMSSLFTLKLIHQRNRFVIHWLLFSLVFALSSMDGLMTPKMFQWHQHVNMISSCNDLAMIQLNRA